MDHCIGRFASYRNSCRQGGRPSPAGSPAPAASAPRPISCSTIPTVPGSARCMVAATARCRPHAQRAMNGFLEEQWAGNVPFRAERAEYVDWVHSPEGQAIVATGGDDGASVWTRLCGRRITGPEGRRTHGRIVGHLEGRPARSEPSRISGAGGWRQPASRELLRILSPCTWEEMAGNERQHRPLQAQEAAP